jgi:3-hydroxybutyryl-CoA dehydrogenase
MEIRNVAVVGAGTMGNGIAQVFATSGYPTLLLDSNPAALERALETIRGSLDRMVKKESITAGAREAALGAIRTSSALRDAARSDRWSKRCSRAWT